MQHTAVISERPTELMTYDTDLESLGESQSSGASIIESLLPRVDMGTQADPDPDMPAVGVRRGATHGRDCKATDADIGGGAEGDKPEENSEESYGTDASSVMPVAGEFAGRSVRRADRATDHSLFRSNTSR